MKYFSVTQRLSNPPKCALPKFAIYGGNLLVSFGLYQEDARCLKIGVGITGKDVHESLSWNGLN